MRSSRRHRVPCSSARTATDSIARPTAAARGSASRPDRPAPSTPWRKVRVCTPAPQTRDCGNPWTTGASWTPVERRVGAARASTRSPPAGTGRLSPAPDRRGGHRPRSRSTTARRCTPAATATVCCGRRTATAGHRPSTGLDDPHVHCLLVTSDRTLLAGTGHRRVHHTRRRCHAGRPPTSAWERRGSSRWRPPATGRCSPAATTACGVRRMARRRGRRCPPA